MKGKVTHDHKVIGTSLHQNALRNYGREMVFGRGDRLNGARTYLLSGGPAKSSTLGTLLSRKHVPQYPTVGHNSSLPLTNYGNNPIDIFHTKNTFRLR